MKIYAWGIDVDNKRIACGVICADNSKEVEKIARSDWEIKDGYFSYSVISATDKNKSILLYKNMECQNE
jgi:hypothetical protein